MYLNVKGLTIYYEKYGNSQDIILILPGWGNTRETFNYIVNSLKGNNTIYILDYPGLGNSPNPNKTLTIYDYTELIIEFMKKLNIKWFLTIMLSISGVLTIVIAFTQNITQQWTPFRETAFQLLTPFVSSTRVERSECSLPSSEYLRPFQNGRIRLL